MGRHIIINNAIYHIFFISHSCGEELGIGSGILGSRIRSPGSALILSCTPLLKPLVSRLFVQVHAKCLLTPLFQSPGFRLELPVYGLSEE